MRIRGFIVWSLVVPVCIATPVLAEEYLTGIEWQEPPIIEPDDASGPPSDAVVLFDGEDLSKWHNGENWPVRDGVAFSGSGVITSKDEFGDCQVHIEWSAPTPPSGEGQGRGNSGVFLMGRYELQVLDSYDNKTYFDGQASAIYKQTPPMANAMRPPGEWNIYDILWTAPRFNDDGSLKSPAYITVLHNGVVTLNHFELLGDTPYHRPPHYEQHAAKGPITLQDHGNPVRFRNIWVRELKPPRGKRVRKPFLRDGDKETPIEKQAAAEVDGMITVDGEPLRLGKVILAPHGAGESLEANVKDGRVLLEQIAPGQYRVAIQSADEKLNNKYGDSDKSGLVIQVSEGKHTINFDLTPR